jgi:serine protease AprX
VTGSRLTTIKTTVAIKYARDAFDLLAAIGLQLRRRSTTFVPCDMARRLILLLIAIALLVPASASADAALDAALAARAQSPRGSSQVIVTTAEGGRADAAIVAVGGSPGRFLPRVGHVAIIPDSALLKLAARADIVAVSLDRPVTGSVEGAASVVDAKKIAGMPGFDGSGIGVAIIDSGVANWHDDLGPRTVVHFMDFVTDLLAPHDDYGHGTHVAGVIAGNGYDSGGARRGVAPGAHLVVLKVLDAAGDGHISDVIAAIDYAIEHRERFNIRVINLSVSAGVHESYKTDPLTLAAKRAVDAGIVVVTAAGNLGRSARGTVQYGGITSPGNAPWVLTVGAADQHKTASRGDDTIAPFSSRGPTSIDEEIKPDIVAPGVAVESLADPSSTIFKENPQARIAGTVDTVAAPYISLTGTSMAAPAVAGTVALLLEANPDLTPNLVKAILQYTAERRSRYDLVSQGGGFLNARGAVQLAMELAGERPASTDPTRWSRQIVWGGRRITGGVLTMNANAWGTAVTWGAAATPEGDPIVWGTVADSGDAWTVPAERGAGAELAYGTPRDPQPKTADDLRVRAAALRKGGSD